MAGPSLPAQGGVLRPTVLPPPALPWDCLEVWLLESKAEMGAGGGGREKEVGQSPSHHWAVTGGSRPDL